MTTTFLEIPATLPNTILRAPIVTDTLFLRIDLTKTPNGQSVPAELACVNFGELAEEYALLVKIAGRAYATGNESEGAIIERLLGKLDYLREEACETLPSDTVYGLTK